MSNAAKRIEKDGIVTDSRELQCKASTVILVKNIADYLERHYPGWLWAVRPNEHGGVVTIYSLRLSGKWGYLLHLKTVQQDPRMDCVIRAGGEVLERFKMRRGPYDYQRWQAAQRTINGMVAFDISDKSNAVQRSQRDRTLTDAVKNGSVRLHHRDTPTATGTHRQIWLEQVRKNSDV